MPTPLPPLDPHDDDAIAEAVADEVTARIMRDHPTSSPAFRKRLVRLYIRQAVGSEAPSGKITGRSLAGYLGLAPQRLSEIEGSALARAWKTYHDRFPELF